MTFGYGVRQETFLLTHCFILTVTYHTERNPSEEIHKGQFKHPQEQKIDQNALQQHDRFSFQ